MRGSKIEHYFTSFLLIYNCHFFTLKVSFRIEIRYVELMISQPNTRNNDNSLIGLITSSTVLFLQKNVSLCYNICVYNIVTNLMSCHGSALQTCRSFTHLSVTGEEPVIDPPHS